MRAFSTLIRSLDETNKTSGKLEALEAFFATASEQDSLWMIALFTGRRPRRTVTLRLLAQWAAEAAELPAWLTRECYTVVGDFAESISLILPPPAKPVERSLTEWIEFIRGLAALDERKRRTAIEKAWSELSVEDRFPFHKLLTGAMRLGVSQGLLVRALAAHHQVEKAIMAHRLTGNWHPDDISYRELLLEPSSTEDASKPYPFFLAHPIESLLEEGHEGLSDRLGSLRDWSVEWKWDGIRGQLISRRGMVYLWSRGEELVTGSYPEIQVAGARLPDGTVLDGEILAWKEGRPMNFQSLQSRIGRKSPGRDILRRVPVVFMAYDLLEQEGQDIRTEPLLLRRKLLSAILEKHQSGALVSSETLEASSWAELALRREESRDRGTEGLMLKRKESPYRVGRVRGDWWKWKIDPYTVDAVMVYAQPGHGRRADLYTDYTFAVWRGEELVTFTKAYTGLTDAEIREVDAWIRKHTLDRRGPVRFVEPVQVFEIAFEGIARSSRHKSGIALRFPRMKRWRRDKAAAEADHFSSLLNLLSVQHQDRPELPRTGSLFEDD